MKNADEFSEKYYNAYKNDYDNNNELNGAKKKKVGYKKFELFDKTDKKLTLHKETKKFFKEIESPEKIVDKKSKKYFSCERTALVNNLLSQNTQGLKNV